MPPPGAHRAAVHQYTVVLHRLSVTLFAAECSRHWADAGLHAYVRFLRRSLSCITLLHENAISVPDNILRMWMILRAAQNVPQRGFCATAARKCSTSSWR
jgi:hypothetical protein